MITKIKTSDMSRSAWLAERRKSIGGSEVGAILGLNKYASAYSVWANKTGQVPDIEPNEAMRQGTDLEDYVAHRFAELSGWKVARENYILRNSDYPHLHANIDRRIIGQKAGLECKTASAYSAGRFAGENFPESYYAQCVAYMAITGYPYWYLAVVVLGKEFKVFQLTPVLDAATPEWCEGSTYVSPAEFVAIRDAAAEFWHYIETDTEPPADSGAGTAEALLAVHPHSDGTTIDLFGCDRLVEDYLSAKERSKAAAQEADAIANQLKRRLGDAECGTCSDFAVSWKSQSRRSLDTKQLQAAHPELNLSDYYHTTEYRKFEVKEI